MRKTVCGLLAVSLLVVALGSGCATYPSEVAMWSRIHQKAVTQNTDSTQTPGERLHTFRRVVDQDARAIIDDIDYYVMRDRPSRLSRWHNR